MTMNGHSYEPRVLTIDEVLAAEVAAKEERSTKEDVLNLVATCRRIVADAQSALELAHRETTSARIIVAAMVADTIGGRVFLSEEKLTAAPQQLEIERSALLPGLTIRVPQVAGRG